MKKLISSKELSDYLGVSLNTIRSWVWMKRIPYLKLGRLVRFDMNTIEAWLKDRAVGVRMEL